MPSKLFRHIAIAVSSLSALAAATLPAGPARSAEATPSTESPIKHVVVIVQENHSFDSYFAAYCEATKTCNLDTSNKNPYAPLSPVPVNDVTGMSYDPNHDQACELAEIDGGKMDGYVQPHPAESIATGYPCGNPADFAEAAHDETSPDADPTAPAATYQRWASTRAALADRYFQPIAGASSSNDMYLWTSRYVFTDNSVEPDAVGKQCSSNTNVKHETGPNLGSLLSDHGVSWAWYAEGYTDMQAAGPGCPPPPVDCGAHVPMYPCVFDPSDIPAEYYDGNDTPEHMRDETQLASDITSGTLPAVTFVKAIGYRSEHPGYGSKLSDGVAFVKRTVDAVLANPDRAKDTLVLLTWDESGGYFDHAAPPPSIETYPGTKTPVPYGPRVPLLALGPFAKAGSVSHVQLEHSSITKFIEWNWLGHVGQLGGRDATVHNLGSLLDPAQVQVPPSMS